VDSRSLDEDGKGMIEFKTVAQFTPQSPAEPLLLLQGALTPRLSNLSLAGLPVVLLLLITPMIPWERRC